MAKSKNRGVQLNVEFGTVGINKESVRLGVKVGRDKLSVDEADTLLTNAQLQTKLFCDPNARKDADGQCVMDAGNMELSAITDCAGFGVRSDRITFSLVLLAGEIDIGELARFNNKPGVLICSRTGDSKSAGDEVEPE